MTQQLSPVAQAVQFAAFRVYDEEEHLYVVPAEKHAGMVAAAALRAVADQVAPCEECPGRPLNSNALEMLQFQDRFSRWHQASLIQQQIYAIANELEAQ